MKYLPAVVSRFIAFFALITAIHDAQNGKLELFNAFTMSIICAFFWTIANGLETPE